MTKDLLREADINWGGDQSSPTLERFAFSLPEDELLAQLYTRFISEEDQPISYALQLLAENKKDKDEWIPLFRRAWLINPKDSGATQFIGSSGETFGGFY